MQTAREFLIQTFGPSAERIEGLAHWGDQTISGATLVITEESRTFVSCGGQALISLERKHTIDKRPMYLVLDNSDGSRWSCRRRELEAKHKAGGETNEALTKEEWHEWHASRPSDKMRLAQSA